MSKKVDQHGTPPKGQHGELPKNTTVKAPQSNLPKNTDTEQGESGRSSETEPQALNQHGSNSVQTLKTGSQGFRPLSYAQKLAGRSLQGRPVLKSQDGKAQGIQNQPRSHRRPPETSQ